MNTREALAQNASRLDAIWSRLMQVLQVIITSYYNSYYYKFASRDFAFFSFDAFESNFIIAVALMTID